ncbi:MAG: TonB-dependent receptor, partial [Bacteroidota bacterium]
SLQFDEERVLLNSVLKSENTLESNRFSGYLQNTYTFKKDSAAELKLTAGVRAAYWDLNDEFIFSPRAQLLYRPFKTKNQVTYKLAAGIYQQAPFYRELRRRDGTVNTNLQSQKSLHVVGGFIWDFKMFKNNPKDFRLVAEAYYKKLWDLVSYDIDNVRIRYSGENDAEGYVAGLDLRLNGEFVPGAESWINLSFLQAKERLVGVQHLRREIGATDSTLVNYVPRPTDRLINLNMFFQDYLPNNENFKVHLNLSFGTGLPYGLRENNDIYRNTYRFRSYQRVDVGFSALLWNKDWKNKRPSHLLSFTQNAWISLEVFNLMKILNVASNTWVKTVFNQQFAVPNRLTSRRINLRLKVDF